MRIFLRIFLRIFFEDFYGISVGFLKDFYWDYIGIILGLYWDCIGMVLGFSFMGDCCVIGGWIAFSWPRRCGGYWPVGADPFADRQIIQNAFRVSLRSQCGFRAVDRLLLFAAAAASSSSTSFWDDHH